MLDFHVLIFVNLVMFYFLRMRTSAGTVSLYPRQLFCYKRVIDSLKVLISWPGFYEKCELWRTRLVPEDSLMDI